MKVILYTRDEHCVATGFQMNVILPGRVITSTIVGGGYRADGYTCNNLLNEALLYKTLGALHIVAS